MTKTIRSAVISLAASLLLGAAPSYAHHSFPAEYDASKPVKFTGKVTKVEWTNPHIFIYVDVPDEKSGEVVNWALEGNSIANYARNGFNRNTLKAGQEVTALVYVSKVPNNPAGVIAKFTTADGKEVLRFQRDEPGGRGVD